MNPLTRYYIHQAGGGGGGIGGGVGPIYSVPPFVQRGNGLGSLLGGLFLSIRPLLFSGLRTSGKALGREALRRGGKILTDIADNPQTGIKEIISKHVQSTVQNLGTKMTGRGRIRKRRSTSRAKNLNERLNAQPRKEVYTQTRRYQTQKYPLLYKKRQFFVI